ncbi:penicillin-binding transpeptidase domain-containing protein [Pseudomonas sp. 7P_10.2_Bac1]|uniref:penicillin-binding transpeptidase domain-containing protein n=1 Tax=Pseudomonas sp. 7P_10.2_Bac1 TaxID=2971614 RepID=UPI003965B0E9
MVLAASNPCIRDCPNRALRYIAFGFGNADLSGDPGGSNGLDRSWISSSLKISPLEQLHFQEKIARRELHVSELSP